MQYPMYTNLPRALITNTRSTKVPIYLPTYVGKVGPYYCILYMALVYVQIGFG